MKKYSFYFAAIIIIAITACNNAEKDHSGHSSNIPKTEADSLMHQVEEGHNFGMGKMGKLTRAEQTARRIIDSISKLPAKAQQQIAPLKTQLESLQKELSYAESAMNKWMNEFSLDSAVNDAKKRIDYLTSEKIKVEKVKENIVTGLQKADSLLKGKF